MASIRKRGNSYQITVSNGRDQTGRQLVETATFVPDPDKTDRQNQKALDRFVIEFEDKVKSGKYLDGEKLTYSDFIKMWLEDYAKKQMEQTTVERCENALNNHILPELGHLKLAKIQPLHIQKLYDDMIATGYTRNGKHYDYSMSSIKRVHQIISSSLTQAVYWQLIESNPCSRIKPPKVKRSIDVKHFTLEQAQIFLDQLDKPYSVMHCARAKKDGSPSVQHYEEKTVPLQYKVLFYMALYGGFRRGELVALQWSDIDYKSGTVSITKSTATTKDGQITKQPKTRGSVRLVSLPDNVMRMIRKHEIEQKKYQLSVGTYWRGEDYLFTQDNGQQINISTPNAVFKKIIKRYNKTAAPGKELPLITLHGLRHTSATLLISQNVDVRTVSGRLGHADTSTTLDIYAHALQKADEQAAASLDQLFRKKA